MPTDLIRYDLMVQEALKGVVRRVLVDTVRDGLPGEHHFYVSFRTDHAGVRLSARLRERYPQDMTIVLQHQFEDLTVNDQGFEVGLSFSGVPERLRVPFEALTGFFDPSVQFGLKFEANEKQEEGEAETPPAAEPIPLKPPKEASSQKTGRSPRKPKEPAEKAPDERSGSRKPDEDGKEPVSGAEVVSLDAFRRKS